MVYSLHEINGLTHAKLLHSMNEMEPDRFPPLQLHHLKDGFWWVAKASSGEVAGFTGLVAMTPFPKVGYLKRAHVVPAHRGHHLQRDFISIRERKARLIGWIKLVTECAIDNARSRTNIEAMGFTRVTPEQPWGAKFSVYFEKDI